MGQKLRKLCCGHTDTARGLHGEQGWSPACGRNKTMLNAKSMFPDFGVRFSRKTAAAKGAWNEKITYYPDSTKVQAYNTDFLPLHRDSTGQGSVIT